MIYIIQALSYYSKFNDGGSSNNLYWTFQNISVTFGLIYSIFYCMVTPCNYHFIPSPPMSLLPPTLTLTLTLMLPLLFLALESSTKISSDYNRY